MDTENNTEINLKEVFWTIETADVLVIAFPLFDERLLVDTRCNESVGPLIKVVPAAGSIRKRVRHIAAIRPQFPPPKRLMVVAWPKAVSSMVRLGVWTRVEQRCLASGSPEVDAAFQEAFDALLALERRAMQTAVVGDGHHTLWQRGQAD